MLRFHPQQSIPTQQRRYSTKRVLVAASLAHHPQVPSVSVNLEFVACKSL